MDRHYGMDMKDGAEIVQTLKLQKCEIPLIGMTAFANDDEINDFKSKGLDDIMTKPLRRDLFIKTVSSIYYIYYIIFLFIYYIEYIMPIEKVEESVQSPISEKETSSCCNIM